MNQFREKEILGDALIAQRAATHLFNTCSNECIHENLRTTLLDILSDEHTIQQDVFGSMRERGFYSSLEATQTKIFETKEKYTNSFKPL